MSVASKLGLGAGLRSVSLLAAERVWPDWVAEDASLCGPAGMDGLAEWLRIAEPSQADRLLHGLVRLGSPSGGDQLLAVDVVAWALLPGARVLAHRLRDLSPDVDGLVATQLWLEVREFPWKRLRKVAANVLANTRARVLASEAPMALRRGHGGDAPLRLLDPHSAAWQCRPDPAERRRPAAAAELADVLSDALNCGAVTDSDATLLRTLLQEADLVGGGGAQRGRGGLLADRVVDRVAAVTGFSPATVRRRVRNCVVAVAHAQRAGLIEAA